MEELLDGISEGVWQLNQKHARHVQTMRNQLDELTGVLAARCMEPTSGADPITLEELAEKPKRALSIKKDLQQDREVQLAAE